MVRRKPRREIRQLKIDSDDDEPIFGTSGNMDRRNDQIFGDMTSLTFAGRREFRSVSATECHIRSAQSPSCYARGGGGASNFLD